MPKRFQSLIPRPAHVSHRGGSGVAPENTMLAFRAAVSRWRTDQLELDIRLTRDGGLVVFHDESVERTTDGQGKVADLTVAELQRLDAGYHFSSDGGRTFPHRGTGVRIPTFEELLRELPLPMMVDVKDGTPAAVDAAAALVRHHRPERICIGSWDDDAGARLLDALPDAAIFFPANAARDFVMSLVFGKQPPPSAFDVLALPSEDNGLDVVSPALLAAADARGLGVQVWVVDDEPGMRRFIERGVGGVQTDRPDVLRHVLDASGQSAESSRL